MSPIFDTLIEPSDQVDQFRGIIGLSLLASKLFVSEVSIAFPKSNFKLFLLKSSLILFNLKYFSLSLTVPLNSVKVFLAIVF